MSGFIIPGLNWLLTIALVIIGAITGIRLQGNVLGAVLGGICGLVIAVIIFLVTVLVISKKTKKG